MRLTDMGLLRPERVPTTMFRSQFVVVQAAAYLPSEPNKNRLVLRVESLIDRFEGRTDAGRLGGCDTIVTGELRHWPRASALGGI